MYMSPLTLTAARNQLLSLADRLEREPETVVEVTRRGRHVMALLSAQRYAALVETLDILSDPQAMRLIRRARKDVASGKAISWKKARKELGIAS